MALNQDIKNNCPILILKIIKNNAFFIIITIFYPIYNPYFTKKQRCREIYYQELFCE